MTNKELIARARELAGSTRWHVDEVIYHLWALAEALETSEARIAEFETRECCDNARRDYQDMRLFQKRFIESDHARRRSDDRIAQLVRRLEKAEKVCEAAEKFHGNVNESIYTQNCQVCKGIEAWRNEVGREP